MGKAPEKVPQFLPHPHKKHVHKNKLKHTFHTSQTTRYIYSYTIDMQSERKSYATALSTLPIITLLVTSLEPPSLMGLPLDTDSHTWKRSEPHYRPGVPRITHCELSADAEIMTMYYKAAQEFALLVAPSSPNTTIDQTPHDLPFLRDVCSKCHSGWSGD